MRFFRSRFSDGVPNSLDGDGRALWVEAWLRGKVLSRLAGVSSLARTRLRVSRCLIRYIKTPQERGKTDQSAVTSRDCFGSVEQKH